jgi:hypothetical protein
MTKMSVNVRFPDAVPLEQSGMRSVLFDSFAHVPEAWYEVCSPDDLAMDLRVLEVFRSTLKDQCRCWALLIFDDSGTVIGCAALCAFKTGGMKVMFCGLPVPSGATHLRVRDGADIKMVVEEVERVMQQLAASQECRLLVFKEFGDNTDSLTATLREAGYICGDIPPMHVLDGRFKSFTEYQNAIKSRYRKQIRSSQQQLEAAGFEIFCGRGAAFFKQHYNDDVHQLYVAVQKRAKHKLELMPASFFTELAEVLGNEVLLTLIRRDSRVCAFTFAITRGETHYNLYSGLDYELNNEGDLYFNLFYTDMDQAFSAGATSLHLGQTSDDFKSRLGTKTERLHFYVHARSRAFHALLRMVSPLAFPKVKPVRPHDVFSTPPKKKKR